MDNMNETAKEWMNKANKNAGLILVLGIVAVIAGFLSLMWPWLSGLGIAIAIGFMFLLGGIARLAGAFCAGSFGRGTLVFIGGALTLVAGVILIGRPGLGLATLTFMLGAFLMIDGVFSFVLAFQMRPDRGWGGVLLNAILSFLLGILLLVEWPLSGLWAIGTLFGIHMMFTGFTMISIGSAARRLAKGLA